MKNFAFAFCGVSAVIVGSLPQSAEALPFYQNCASMQSYLNSKPWRTPTRLSGMENSQMIYQQYPNGEETAICDGYITESSPMGRKICQGKVSYFDPKGKKESLLGFLSGSIYPSYSWSATSNASCRWR